MMTISYPFSDINSEEDSQHYQILVVDDEPLLCRMLTVMLSRPDFEIRTASNGNEALEAVSASKPDLITLDIMMPGISGLEVARRLRLDTRSASIPILFITAMDSSISDELRALCKEPGIYHLDKPFNQHDLLKQVTCALCAFYSES
jgi:two-component system, sensor histidine kinase and response regulator